VLDNLRRKPMSLEGYLDHPETVAAPDRFGHRLNVSMPWRQRAVLNGFWAPGW